MKQLFIDFFSQPKESPKKPKPKKSVIITPVRVDDGDYHYYLAKSCYEITMDGQKVIYEDGLTPYRAVFASVKEAYDNILYWCKTADQDARKFAH